MSPRYVSAGIVNITDILILRTTTIEKPLLCSSVPQLKNRNPLPRPPCYSPGDQGEGRPKIAPIGGTCPACGNPLFPLSPFWVDARGVMRPTAASLVGWLHRQSMWLHKVHSCGRTYMHGGMYSMYWVCSSSIKTINQQCRDSVCHPREMVVWR
ncbi:hypothetical protein HDV57DRAFT_431499 [Trichoderma longibrachiatum]|uniref:Uncharacterized protein n=1 Tax=Trichoderma longibrachiatum ATCC 18648 TaxID=983965 RepID=A0A2T4CFC8_TRILO|nr:hypothetical protein M440DRAFT_1397612 [Trichoderma longibrachiatum ATCC 18648]